MKRIALIPYACGAGASTAGTEFGPGSLESRGLTDALKARGLDAYWHSDPTIDEDAARAVQDHPHGSPTRDQFVFDHLKEFGDACADALTGGDFPVTIGGDHSMAVGSIAAFARAKNAHGRIGVLWFDAHADLNTHDTSPSQALHGMPLAALLGLGRPDWVALCGDKTVLAPENLFYIGLRDVDPGEWDAIQKMNIAHLTAEQVRAIGMQASFRQAIDHLRQHADYLFISFDLDGLDPADAPAVGTPVADGLRLEDTLQALRETVAQWAPSMIEITEFNPHLENPEKTYDTLVEVLAAMTIA